MRSRRRCFQPPPSGGDSRCGNYLMLRAYSGMDDFIQYAKVLTDSIHNVWCAIPFFWFNQMDGRGSWDLEGSIRKHQQVMAWYGERDLPVHPGCSTTQKQ